MQNESRCDKGDPEARMHTRSPCRYAGCVFPNGSFRRHRVSRKTRRNGRSDRGGRGMSRSRIRCGDSASRSSPRAVTPDLPLQVAQEKPSLLRETERTEPSPPVDHQGPEAGCGLYNPEWEYDWADDLETRPQKVLGAAGPGSHHVSAECLNYERDFPLGSWRGSEGCGIQKLTLAE